MTDAFSDAFFEIEQAARDNIISEYLEEKSCIIFDRIAAATFVLADADLASFVRNAIDTAMHDWAQDEADGKHTRDAK